MNIKIVMLLTVGMLLSTISSAQIVKAVDGGNGNIEIDCRGIKGATTTSKGTTNRSTDTTSSNQSDEYTSEAANRQIFQRFEVAKGDEGTGEMYWSVALKKCRDLEGSWRLPTHRELILIKVLAPELKAASNQFTSLDPAEGYWSATVIVRNPMNPDPAPGDEYTDIVWAVGPAIGDTAKDRTITTEGKTNPPNKVRCIRELSTTR